MKELSATSTWQDVTHATIIDKGLPLRKGFGSLSDAIDVGSVSLTLHMESLDAAALLHTSRKQVLIHADGAPIFEGVSFDDADVDLDMNTDYIYASLKFKPYSSLFEQAKVPSDTVLTDVKICDPADAEHSLVHILFGMIIENMPDPLPAIISPSFGITTSVSNTKVLPLVILEKGESLEDILTSVLYQNGYTYYMEQFSVILIEPYASGREPTSQVPITSILAKPSISQAPYIKETKCSVRFPRVEQYANEVVYELNGDRIEGTDEPSQVQVLEPADYYPTDDEEPATLEADYSTERETDDIELVYVTGATLDVHTRALSGDSTVRVHITAGTHELDPTKARIQLYNNLSYDVSLRNIRVLAGIAYYRNWSALYEDDDTTATDTDEIDGLFMPDTATARAFISRYRSEISAEKTSVEFSTHLDFAPGTLIELSGLPYWLLIRSVTDRRDGSDIKDYSCVAYRIHTVETSTRIRVSGNAKVRNAFSPVPVRLFALGNAEAPYEDSIVVADDAMIASDNNAILGASAAWQLTRPTPGAGEYVWYIIGWYTPPSTWPQTWTVPVKDEGLAAYALQLSAPEGTNFYMSGRGVLQTPTLKFTAILSNIPPASVVWTASNGTLIEVTGDAYSRQLDCSTVSQDNVQITISAMVAGQSYSASIGVQRVRETLVTKYFGISNEMLVNMHGEPLASGDTFLYMPKVGEAYDDTNPLFGHVLKWDGDSWESTTDSQSIGFAAKDAFQIARESGKVIFAAVIYTEAMVAANIQAGSGTGAAGSGFRFRAMDDDYSQGGSPKVPRFDVYDGDMKLFEVDPVSKNINIGDYDSGNGLRWDHVQKKFYIRGHVDADSGNIKGQLDTLTLQTLLGGDTEYPKGDYTTVESLLTMLIGEVAANTSLRVTGTINGVGFKSVAYGDISIQQARRYNSGTVLWETWYKTASALVCTVSISFTMDNDSKVTYVLRKIKANTDSSTNTISYEPYPSIPAGYTDLISWADYYAPDPSPGHVPSAVQESQFNDVAPLRNFPYPVLALSVWDSSRERLFIKSLPTSAPSESGRVWRDGTTLKIVP